MFLQDLIFEKKILSFLTLICIKMAENLTLHLCEIVLGEAAKVGLDLSLCVQGDIERRGV